MNLYSNLCVDYDGSFERKYSHVLHQPNIEYVKEKRNVIANLLSRIPIVASGVSCVRNSLIDEIKIHHVSDEILELPFISLSKESRSWEEI